MSRFIVVEYNYCLPHKSLKISIVDNNEYVVISNESYIKECIEIIYKLPLEYEIILDVEYGMFNCISDELCNLGIYDKLIKLSDKNILKLLKESGGRLSVIGAYVELLHLNYNKDLVKGLLD